MSTSNLFVQPYLASNDNRSVAGIDCPVCKSRNKAIPLHTVPINQAVRIFTEHDLQPRVLGNTSVPYGDPNRLPEEFRSNASVTFWRCENCDLVFQREFNDWSIKQLKRQIYNTEYVKLLPNLSTDLPRYRATFLRSLFREKIKDLDVLICESSMGALAEELFNNRINARSYQLFNAEFNHANLGTFDLICAFMVLERLPEPEETLRQVLSHCKEDFVFLLARYPFNFKNESEHTMLSPRNGFFRFYSPKSLEIVLERLKLDFIHVTPSITLAFRRIPDFAAFLTHENLSEEELIASVTEALENEEDTAENSDQDAEHQKTLQIEHDKVAEPSPVTFHTSRTTIRKTLFGMTAYNSRDRLVGLSLDHYGEYLRGDHELLEQLIRPNWVIFDAAANIGLHTMMMAALLHEGGVIHAFEPYDENFQLLGTNMLLNDLSNVRTYQMALGAEVGQTRLSPVNPHEPGSMAAKGWSTDFSGPSMRLETLDALSPKDCHFIHVCVPECEPDILLGASKTLSRFQPVLLVNCVSDENFKTIFHLLTQHHYRMYWHIQPFFQTENFFGNTTNIFGSAGVAKILALPAEKEQNIGLTEITSEDDWIA